MLNSLQKLFRKFSPTAPGYPWIVITLSAAFLFYKYILQISPSVMTNELMVSFNINATGLGNLAAIFFYSYSITQLFAGPLLDKYNPRLLTATTIALCALGAFLFAHANSLLMAQLARALIGVGAAFATISYMKMLSIWFEPKYFAFVSGLLATAAMAGSMAGQIPMAYLVSTVGWQTSLSYCGTLGLILAAMFYLIVKNKSHHEAHSLTEAGISWSDVWLVIKNRANWYLMAYGGLAFAPLAAFGGLWGVPFLQAAHGLSRPAAASLTSMVFLGLAFGAPILGIVSDRLNRRYPVMVGGSLIALISLSLAIYLPHTSVYGIGILLFLFGFGTGSFMLCFAMAKELNALTLAATVVALINTGDAILGAVSEPLVGKILDLTWDGTIINQAHYFTLPHYRLALGLLPLYLFAALLSLLGLRGSK